MKGLCCDCQGEADVRPVTQAELVLLTGSDDPAEQERWFYDMSSGGGRMDPSMWICVEHDASGQHCPGSGTGPQAVYE